jgi:hypothetical protein
MCKVRGIMGAYLVNPIASNMDIERILVQWAEFSTGGMDAFFKYRC